MRVSAIIAAGGQGVRLGGVAKQLRLIGDRTMLERSIEPFEASDRITEIVVVLPSEVLSSVSSFLMRFHTPLRVVAGGARRQDSVAAGLTAVNSATEIVVVHDAARPFCPVDLIAVTIEGALECGVAIAALPARDTVKVGQDDHGTGLGFVNATLEREQIFLAQTPQAFRLGVLRDAVRLGARLEATDEAFLAERAGHRVRLVEGSLRNIKVTTDSDLELAREMAGKAAAVSPSRVGLGYDLHRLVKGRRLVLGGVYIPGDHGLLGHSDADAVCHAVIDAVLGAASEGDIGSHFPDDDDRWKDVSSIDLLRRATTIVRNSGFSVCNVDVVVVAEWPKIRSHVNAMRKCLADALQVRTKDVGIKGKTNEGIGVVGRHEAIVVHAIASVQKI